MTYRQAGIKPSIYTYSPILNASPTKCNTRGKIKEKKEPISKKGLISSVLARVLPQNLVHWCRSGKVHKATETALQLATWKKKKPMLTYLFLAEESPPCQQSVLRSSWLVGNNLTFSQTRHHDDLDSPALTVTALTNCSLQLLLPTTRARFVFLISLSTVLCGRAQERQDWSVKWRTTKTKKNKKQ